MLQSKRQPEEPNGCYSLGNGCKCQNNSLGLSVRLHGLGLGLIKGLGLDRVNSMGIHGELCVCVKDKYRVARFELRIYMHNRETLTLSKRYLYDLARAAMS